MGGRYSGSDSDRDQEIATAKQGRAGRFGRLRTTEARRRLGALETARGRHPVGYRPRPFHIVPDSRAGRRSVHWTDVDALSRGRSIRSEVRHIRPAADPVGQCSVTAPCCPLQGMAMPCRRFGIGRRKPGADEARGCSQPGMGVGNKKGGSPEPPFCVSEQRELYGPTFDFVWTVFWNVPVRPTTSNPDKVKVTPPLFVAVTEYVAYPA
jgi:hypothetical protein